MTEGLAKATVAELARELCDRIGSDIIVVDADPRIAAAVIAAPIGNDGRSEWKWIRLPNGSLVLATYPEGDTYELTEVDRNRP